MKKYSTQEVADYFGLDKLTIYNWIRDPERIPIFSSLSLICLKMRTEFGWEITQNDLLNTDISEKFSFEEAQENEVESFYTSYSSNIVDFAKIANRLKILRANKGWSLVEASDKSKEFFPGRKEYHISHMHISDIEKQNVVNYHINKLKALSTIYGVTLEYILFGRNVPSEVSIDRDNNLLIVPLRGLSDGAIKRLVAQVKNTVELV